MSTLFWKLLNMSISAGWLILAVMVLRLVLRKAPRGLRCALWGIVALRLVLPFSLESPVSLIPNGETVSASVLSGGALQVSTGVDLLDRPVSNYLEPSSAVTATAGGGIHWMELLSWLWLAGVAILLAYGLVSWLALRRRVAEAVPLRDNLWLCDRIPTPFILGLFRPRIYLPSHMAEEDIPCVEAHERAHLARRDHWWKPLGFLLLAVYWFNPLVWAAYLLFCRDLELACDEHVVAGWDAQARQAYARALLSCSVSRPALSACPLAFGEVGVKERVKAVFRCKKPALWALLAAAGLCVAVAVCFLTDPEQLTLDNITSERGYAITSQTPYVLTLSVPKGTLTEDCYTGEGQVFRENEVPAFQNDTTTIYLEQVMPSNEGDEYLVFMFNCSYQLPESGTILLPYQKSKDGYRLFAYPASETLTDDSTLYPDAVSLRGLGPGTQFDFYVRTDACRAASGTLEMQLGCNALTYVRLKPGQSSPSGVQEKQTVADVDDVNDAIAELLAEIASSPQEASSTLAYISAHPEAYQQLLDYGDHTLRYCFAQFLDGGQTGLEGAIMWGLICELAPEAEQVPLTGSGQEFFDAWLTSARADMAERGAGWMESHAPAALLLLQTAGG
ncbi:M56 family metallopeptidase [uncultured Pseudoflavonifractor sp.]|uniref:M56 family metallopeptidase n=1 Tax=uncultured Pseudoflavonifractor sp. TaxID=1221379 RepID=UPI0025D76FEC|nr:M56 family metallopeptidase [uncultured Pseudoflavonifractor sp.]